MQILKSHLFTGIVRTPPEFQDYTEQKFIDLLKKAIATATLTAVAEISFRFEPYGTSAVVILEESHVALHFWPECNKMSIDIHVCDYLNNNFHQAKVLTEALSFIDLYPENQNCWNYQVISG